MNKVDTSELKPCPFCGGEAILAFRNICDAWGACSKCDAEGPWREAETDAITAWNTRADDINLQTVLAYESGQQSMQAEIERLRLDLDAKDALNVSAYYAGMKAGWNFCVNEDQINFAAAIASTEHIAELQRINAARQALGDKQ